MRLIDKDRLLKGSNHYWLEMENFGDIEAIDVRFIEMADEVKAIPIEWIEMFLEENYPIESPYGTKAYFHDFMKHMIKEWRKENEAN